jgi:hypothetical protein
MEENGVDGGLKMMKKSWLRGEERKKKIFIA